MRWGGGGGGGGALSFSLFLSHWLGVYFCHLGFECFGGSFVERMFLSQLFESVLLSAWLILYFGNIPLIV